MKYILGCIIIFGITSCEFSGKYEFISEIPEAYHGDYVLKENGFEKLNISNQNLVFTSSNKEIFVVNFEDGIEVRINQQNNDYYPSLNLYPNYDENTRQYFHLTLKKDNLELTLVEYIPTGFEDSMGSFKSEYLKVNN
jgi:hypothetical protein